jgi:hypothetical protein
MSGGKGSPAPVRRWLTPSEFAGELQAAGLARSERWVQIRCTLQVGHPERLETHPAFKGRHLIPELELFRLLSIKSEAAA